MHGYTFSMLVSGTGRGRSILSHVSIKCNLLNKLPDLVIYTQCVLVCIPHVLYCPLYMLSTNVQNAIMSLHDNDGVTLLSLCPTRGGHYKVYALHSNFVFTAMQTLHTSYSTAGFHCLPWSISGMLCDIAKGF